MPLHFFFPDAEGLFRALGYGQDRILTKSSMSSPVLVGKRRRPELATGSFLRGLDQLLQWPNRARMNFGNQSATVRAT
jgi:hypothetical protein